MTTISRNSRILLSGLRKRAAAVRTVTGLVLSLLVGIALVPPAAADTISGVINHLKNGNPILLTMESPGPNSTLTQGEVYWLRYDSSVTPAAFDCQGFSASWGTYHMDHYANGDITRGQVSCWGMQATIADSGNGQLYLLSGSTRVAGIVPIAEMATTIRAAWKFDWDLISYANVARDLPTLETWLQRYYASSFSRTRVVATMLEDIARYKPFIFRRASWTGAEQIMSVLFAYLQKHSLNESLPKTFGVYSDFNVVKCAETCPLDDYLTAATVIRALYAYGSVSGSLVDFRAVSTAFLQQIPLPGAVTWWSAQNPTGRMQIMWVIARAFTEGIVSIDDLVKAHDFLLTPVLREQMTDTTEWMCQPWTSPANRAWGGWIHGRQADASPYTCLLPGLTTYYGQLMKEHLMIVQGLAESYRMLRRENLLDARAFTFFRNNAPYNLLASAAFVHFVATQTDLNQGNTNAGAIYDRNYFASYDGIPDLSGTVPAVQSIYEVLRSFNVQNYMPYYSTYPAWLTSPDLSYKTVMDRLGAALASTDFTTSKTGSQTYSDALYGQFSVYSLGTFQIGKSHLGSFDF